MNRTLVSIAVGALVSLASTANGQGTIYFRINIAVPVGQAAPGVVVQEPPSAIPLADRTKLKAMWDGMAFQVTPIARECAMPVAVSLDSGSFTGHFAASDDGLQPGTRSRFRDFARALTAVCHRGATEQSAVRAKVHGIRFGYTAAASDQLVLQGDTLVIYTNGDVTGPGHLGYAQMIDAITHAL